MNAVEEALEQANQCRNEIWRLWHYHADTGEKRIEKWRLWFRRPPTGVLILCGYHPSFDVTGHLCFQSPSYVRLPQSLHQAHFVLGKEGDEGMPESHLLPATSCAILIRTSAATFCIVCKDVIFTRKIP